MAKILHIMGNDKFNAPYINLVNDNFPQAEHLFVFTNGMTDKEMPIPKYDNCVEWRSKDDLLGKLLLEINKSEKFIIHGLFDRRIILLLSITPWLLKKCSWVIWGGDLYGDVHLSYSKRSLKGTLFFKLKKFVVSRFGNIVFLSPGDELIFERVYKVKCRYLFGMYVNPVTIEQLDEAKQGLEIPTNRGVTKIILGNSATTSNCHLEALEQLSSFKDRAIQIIVPLSYGDKNYAELVIKHGRLIFGDKFIPLLDFMTSDEYAKLLASVDIGVFYNDRQQALGNIYALLYLGKKIFIRSDISSWKYLTEFFNFGINDSLNINSMEYGQFIKVDEEVSKDNNKMSEKYFYNTDYLIDVWNKVFLDR